MLDRMDLDYESVHGINYRKSLKRPSDYFRVGEHFGVSMELGESTLPYVVDKIGSERIIYASDYPHEPTMDDITTELPEFLESNLLNDEAKRNLVYNTAKNLFRIS